MPNFVELVAWYVVFLFSVTFHEAAHAWAAMRGGDLTAYYGGQVSLDPIPHIRREPLGMVVLPIISLYFGGWVIGFASTPYDPVWASRNVRRAAWMSLAGPVSNLALVLIAALLIRVGMAAGVFAVPSSLEGYSGIVEGVGQGTWEFAAMIASVFFSLNLILFVFNLIPLPPLDGSGALPLLMSHEAVNRWQRLMSQPGFRIMGLFVAWKIFGPIFSVVFFLAMTVLYW